MTTRKAVSDGGKYEAILSAATECFFNQGFDGASVRGIMKKAGAEIGLFYYYFNSKDDVFYRVLDRFFDSYERGFSEIVRRGRRNPCRVMQDFFEYMERETEEFRERYEENMHRTVRWAIREHTLTIIEPYLREIVELQSAYYGVEPALKPEVAALYLTHGIGSSILHEQREVYSALRGEIKRGASLIMGMPAELQELRVPFRAGTGDIEAVIGLADSVRGSFPGPEEAVLRGQLEKRVADGEAWVIRRGDEIAAALLFSAGRAELDFLAVKPQYRRRGLARRLVETAAARFPVGTRLSAVTLRSGDARGKDARAFFEAMGFEPDGELELRGYQAERMTAEAPDRALGTAAGRDDYERRKVEDGKL